ncbi:MAG: hypothetical protein HKP39_01815 [Eudoraea sp.]|nr:hypothetical protein [Eudoraea sp.]NNL00991.1 hypothetical protein [Eudoraea sp.]
MKFKLILFKEMVILTAITMLQLVWTKKLLNYNAVPREDDHNFLVNIYIIKVKDCYEDKSP